MHSQLSYTAAKFEIAERHRRAERRLACGESRTRVRRPRRNPFTRLLALRRSSPVAAVELTGGNQG